MYVANWFWLYNYFCDMQACELELLTTTYEYFVSNIDVWNENLLSLYVRYIYALILDSLFTNISCERFK